MNAASPPSPETPDDQPASQEYRTLMARVEAYELWETMSQADRREVVLDHYAVTQWFEEPALSTLASFRQDAPAWGRIKAKGREIGVNVWDLEKAVDGFLLAQGLVPSKNGAPPTPSSSSFLFRPQTLTELLAESLPPLHEVVRGLLHEGLWLFGGKSKRGKSWLMLDLAMAVSCGRAAFGHFPTQQSPVLYLALEDSKRRVKTRALAIEPSVTHRDTLHLVYSFPRLGEGAVEALDDAIQQYGYGLIIVDVMAHIRQLAGKKAGNGEGYQEIYEELRAMQALIKQRHAAIVLVDHLRKQQADDIFDEIQGSVAKQGAADALMVLERKPGENEAFLHIRSKEVEDKVHALRFEQTSFLYLGEGDQVTLEKHQREILKILREEQRGMTVGDILRHTGAGDTAAAYQRCRRLMMALERDDYVKRQGGGPRGEARFLATMRAASEDDVPPF